MDSKKKKLVLDTAAILLWVAAIALNIMDTYFTLLPITSPNIMPLILYPLLSVLLLTVSFALFILSTILYQPLYVEKPLENNETKQYS